jgi:uncharacterized RDD family membrane protein YckC/Tfp pilus assembly major pilin PilA
MAFCSQCGHQLPSNSKFCIKCGHPLEGPTPTAKRGPPPLPTTPPPPTVPNTVKPTTKPAAPAINVYGSFLSRFGAYIVDYFIILLLFAVISVVLAQSGKTGPEQGGKILLSFLCCAWLYKALFESSAWQATLGKKLFSIKVTDLNGNRIGFGQATGRFFAQLLSQISFTIGYLMAAFTERRQALHDMIAGTLVVKRTVTSEEVVNNPIPLETGGASGVVIAAVVVFVMIGVIGILAAIAIPAYQNYTIRAQVTHGLTMADGFKALSAKSISRGNDPAQINSGVNSSTFGELPRSGQYEDSIEVVRGNVLITYGRNANTKIQGKKLLLFFQSTPQGNLIWVCGRGISPPGVNNDDLAQLRAVTDVPAQYLPTSCHE